MEAIHQLNLNKLIIPNFKPVLQEILHHNYTHYDLRGGRGSTKSSFVSIAVVLLLLQNSDCHALILRKVADTLRDSVYAQYTWAIYAMELEQYFLFKVQPMEIIFIPTGQKIMFRGVDKKEKIKSIKVPFGYIGITHFEEKDQFAGREEIRNILQSTMRGGSKFWNFESYNPPISMANWANEDSLQPRKDRLTHSNSYLDVPIEWLGEQFIEEAEQLKQNNFRAYQHELLGIPIGTGSNVFEFLEIKEITKEQIQAFDRIYMGVDFGWYPDPFAFVRLHYDRARNTIYIFDEIYKNKLTNQNAAREIKAKGYTDAYIVCDSAEPKSIYDLKDNGLPVKAAVKGAGSVEYGMKWLQSKTIIIDPVRCPHTAKEFVEYEYERDRDGEVISGYPDKNNHSIDAVRYALERVFLKRGG